MNDQQLGLPTSMTAVITVTVGEGTAIARFEIGGGVGVWIGESKCHPSDVSNPKIGNAYAMGRALQKAGDELVACAQVSVDEAFERQQGMKKCQRCGHERNKHRDSVRSGANITLCVADLPSVDGVYVGHCECSKLR